MGIPLTDIGHEREQGDVAGALDGHRELPLVGGAGARDPPRQDPPTLRHEAPETSDILVVNLLHLVHAELADLLPTIALPSLDHRHWSLPMFGPIVDSRTVPTLCFNLLQLPCRTRPQPPQQAGWSHAPHQVGTALERRLVLCRGRRRLFLPASAPPEELDAVCHHFVLRPLLPFRRLLRALGQGPRAPLAPDRQIPENDLGEFEVPVHGLREGGLALDPEEDVGALPLFLDLERQAASPPLLDLEQLGPFPFEESPKRLHLGLERLLRQSRLVDDDHLVLWHPSTSSPVVSAGSPQAPDCFQTLNRFMADATPRSTISSTASAARLMRSGRRQASASSKGGRTNVTSSPTLATPLTPPKGKTELVVNPPEPLWRDRRPFQPRLDRSAALIHEGEGLDEGDRFISPRLLRVQTLPTATGHRTVPPPRRLLQDHRRP